MSDLQLVFLGTGGSMPTRTRSLPSVAIKYQGGVTLLDCGEAAQRQLIMSGTGFRKDFRILVSHLHGDHILGLPGLLYSMSMLERREELEIYGPPGISDTVEHLLRGGLPELSFPVQIEEVKEGQIMENNLFSIRSALAEHVVDSFAYSFEEKPRPGRMLVDKLEKLGVPRGPLWGRLQSGQQVVFRGHALDPAEFVGPPRRGRKIVYSGDTRPCQRIVDLSLNADILIHEATFDSSMVERAKTEGHSTALEAAEVAKRAGVKRLFLFHISPRYEKNPEILLSEAHQVFPNTDLAEDLVAVDVPHSE